MKRVRPARHYQHPQAPIRLMADRAIPGLARAFKTVLKAGRRRFNAKAAKELLFQGRYRDIADTVDWNHSNEAMRHPLNMLGDLWGEAGKLGARKINGAFTSHRRVVRYRKAARGEERSMPTDGLHWSARTNPITLPENWLAATLVAKDQADLFAFDRYDPVTQTHIRDYQDALIQQLGSDSRDVIEQTVLDAMRFGWSADEIVATIRAVIGLTDRQAKAVVNYRNMLTTMDPGALTRQLASTADREVFQQTFDAGGSLDLATISQMVDNYTNAYLDYRAQMIADTEATRAANLGIKDSYDQAVARGVFPSEAVTRRWQLTLDEKTCPLCLSIVDNNPDGIGLDEDYDSDDGPVDHAPAHPGCRCSEDFITNLDLVPTDEDFEEQA